MIAPDLPVFRMGGDLASTYVDQDVDGSGKGATTLDQMITNETEANMLSEDSGVVVK